MGVPKFYRWIAERYPLINQIISNCAILPEFDNFYLDMNGIIHACTHPNDNHASNSLTLREMMLSIFRYIDRMVTEIVKPKKLLFLAIDGVAPRAKLNQQRARRFRAAQDRLESIEKAKTRGEVVDEDSLFDSNCITPGTEFMDLVSRHLKWFIRKKMKEDPLWRHLTIVFSGHDVPGEGEHKIMQYIRDLRCSPHYEPNIRHCMYGQDADLIMLGLASHEPHFALLREVINFNSNFGRKTARETVIRQTKDAQFQLLHISLLREYISIDFAHGLPPEVSIDQERVIDDFIFLTFLVGNDFLPHLPTLDISEHAFDVLINAYRQLLVEDPPSELNNTGYLVFQGELYDLDRLEKLFSIVGSQEHEILKNREAQKKTFEKKQRSHGTNLLTEEEEEAIEAAKEEAFTSALSRALRGEDVGAEELRKPSIVAPTSTTFADCSVGEVEIEGEETMDSLEKLAAKAENFRLEYEVDSDVEVDVILDEENEGEREEEEEEEKVKEKDFRGRYYFEKFHVVLTTPVTSQSEQFLSTLMQHYLQGLTWCLAYYIKGCISWTWYYPYHYGPMLQDMKHLNELKANISFILGEPFSPFQQLLGCLPPGSSRLLPGCYRWLMLSNDSPVITFYPTEFEIDQDGKKNPWEAVVKLDFINELRLFEAEQVHCPNNKLTSIESYRNQFGKILQYEFDPGNNETYLSCNPEIGLLDIPNCQSKMSLLEYSLAPGHYFQAALIPGTVFPIAGYPCLAMLPISNLTIDSMKINIFGSESKYRSVMLHIDTTSSNAMSQFMEDITKLTMLIGKKVYVNYPQVHEALVVGISTAQEELILDSPIDSLNDDDFAALKTKHYKYDDLISRKWIADAEAERMKYLKGRKLPGTGGLEIGDIVLRLKVRPLQGLVRNPLTGATKKLYANTIEADIPIQMVLWQPPAVDTRFEEREAMTTEELFPLGTSVVAVTSQLIGCKGKVIGPHITSNEEKKLSHSKESLQKKGQKRVDVEFDVPYSEPPFGYSIAHTIQDEYYSSRDLCHLLGISPSVFGKLVGAIRIEPGRHDIGLNLKRNGMYQLLGYARKVENNTAANNSSNKKYAGKGGKTNTIPLRNVWEANESVHIIGMDAFEDANGVNNTKAMEQDAVYWEYSKHTATLICEYKTRFPVLFQRLESLPHQAVYNSVELFGKESDKVLTQIMEWMKLQSFFQAPRTPFSTSSLSKEAMVAIERASDVLTTTNTTKGLRKLVIKGISINQLYTNIHRTSHDVPLTFNPLEPKLGDRIVNLSCAGVPFGLRGTVITIHHATKFVEVIFDEEFISGKSLQGCCSQFRGKLCAWTDLLLLQSVHRDRNLQASGAEKQPVVEEIIVERLETSVTEAANLVNDTTTPSTVVMTKIPIQSLFANKAIAVTAAKQNELSDREENDDDISGASIDQLLDDQQEYDFQGLVSDGTGWYNLSLAAGMTSNEKKLLPDPIAMIQASPWMNVVAQAGVQHQLSYVTPVTFQPSMMNPVAVATSTTTAIAGPKVIINKAATERLVKHELGISRTITAATTNNNQKYDNRLTSSQPVPHPQVINQQQGKTKIAVDSLFKKGPSASVTVAVAPAATAPVATSAKSTMALKAILTKKPTPDAPIATAAATTTFIAPPPPIPVALFEDKLAISDEQSVANLPSPPTPAATSVNSSTAEVASKPKQLKDLLANAKRTMAIKQAHSTSLGPVDSHIATTVAKEPSTTNVPTKEAVAVVATTSNIANLLLNAKKKQPSSATDSSPAVAPVPVINETLSNEIDPTKGTVKSQESPHIISLLKNAKRLTIQDHSTGHAASSLNTESSVTAAVVGSGDGVSHGPPAIQYKSVTTLLPTRVQILKRK